MSRYALMMLSLLLLGMTCAHGQRQLMLKHRIKPEKKRMIDSTQMYEIKTMDKAYESKIVTFSDSTLSVSLVIKTRDSTYTYSKIQTQYAKRGIRLWKKRVGKDTTYTYTEVRPIYHNETLAVSFQDIRVMKKSWFKSTAWLGTVFEIALSPMTKGWRYLDTKELWQVQAVAVVACVPIIFIATGSTRYDLVRKWQLKAEG